MLTHNVKPIKKTERKTGRMLKKILENKKLRSDIILIGTLLIVGLSVLLFMFFTSEDGDRVVVSVGGKTVAEYSMSVDGVYYLNGGTNVLVIEDGYVYMREANCPGFQDCVEKGKISKVGQFILCIPNELLVEIVGEKDGGDVDI